VEELRLYPAHPPDFPERPGFGFPVRFRIETAEDAAFQSTHVVLDASSDDYVNPADNAVIVPLNGLKGRYWRMTATKLWERSQDYVFALAEVEVLSSGVNTAPTAVVTSLDETRTQAWHASMLVDGHTSLGRIVPWSVWLQGLSRRAALESDLAVLKAEHSVLLARRQQHWILGGAVTVLLVLMAGAVLHFRQRVQQRRSLVALRRQIARDLHDEIGSSLGSISLISELAIREGDVSALHEVHRLSREAAESMRGIIWLVRETGAPTLQRLVETMRQTASSLLAGIDWDLRTSSHADEISPPLDFHRHLFLFYKEAVHNIARHARARTVHVELAWAEGVLRLKIQDDGAGFDLGAEPAGSGLANLRHRALALRGKLNITSQPGCGTTILLEAPLP
jgi:signal transduction histidine kinase